MLEDARHNAPLTVLTLDRVVSLQDYEDFTLAYSGIYKALATWTWFQSTRGVFLTVAGFKGSAISLELRQQLRAALSFGQPVSLAVVAAAAQSVRGVAAVQVARLYRSGDSDPEAGLAAPLAARAPQPGERGMVLAAELLTLDPAPLDLLEELS